MAYGYTGGAGGGGFLGGLGGLAGLAGGPWGMAASLGLGALGAGIGIAKAPDAMALSRKRMDFFMQQMGKIPGLADQFRNYLMRGSGNQQANLVGSSQAYGDTMRRSLVGAGLGNTPLAGLVQSMAASRLGQGMSDLYGGYNLAGFQTANDNVMNAASRSLTDDDMRNRMIGAVVGSGGSMLDKMLFPRP